MLKEHWSSRKALKALIIEDIRRTVGEKIGISK
jgi:hypothetical protein